MAVAPSTEQVLELPRMVLPPHSLEGFQFPPGLHPTLALGRPELPLDAPQLDRDIRNLTYQQGLGAISMLLDSHPYPHEWYPEAVNCVRGGQWLLLGIGETHAEYERVSLANMAYAAFRTLRESNLNTRSHLARRTYDLWPQLGYVTPSDPTKAATRPSLRLA